MIERPQMQTVALSLAAGALLGGIVWRISRSKLFGVVAGIAPPVAVAVCSVRSSADPETASPADDFDYRSVTNPFSHRLALDEQWARDIGMLSEEFESTNDDAAVADVRTRLLLAGAQRLSWVGVEQITYENQRLFFGQRSVWNRLTFDDPRRQWSVETVLPLTRAEFRALLADPEGAQARRLELHTQLRSIAWGRHRQGTASAYFTRTVADCSRLIDDFTDDRLNRDLSLLKEKIATLQTMETPRAFAQVRIELFEEALRNRGYTPFTMVVIGTSPKWTILPQESSRAEEVCFEQALSADTFLQLLERYPLIADE